MHNSFKVKKDNMTTREYSPRTIVAYRSRLKTLRLALEVGAVAEVDQGRVQQEVLELEKKLGALQDSPQKQGRPRKYVKLTMAEVEAIKQGKEVDKLAPGYWSPEAIEMRRKVHQMQVEPKEEEKPPVNTTNDPLVAELEQSLGGDDERRKQATDDVGEVGNDHK